MMRLVVAQNNILIACKVNSVIALSFIGILHLPFQAIYSIRYPLLLGVLKRGSSEIILFMPSLDGVNDRHDTDNSLGAGI